MNDDIQSINRNTPERIAQARKAKVGVMTLQKLMMAAAVIGMRPALDFNQFTDGNLAFPKHLGRIDRVRHTKGLPDDKPLLESTNE